MENDSINIIRVYIIIQVALYGNGDNYHLGYDKSISILELAKLFHHPYIFIPERKGERIHSIMQESRAEKELHWKAKKHIHKYIENIHYHENM